MRPPPGRLELQIVSMATLCAGSVSVGERGCLVQEEQFGVRAGCHHLPVTTAKLELTGDPSAHLPVADDLPLGVVQNAAVSHQRAAGGHNQNFAKRRDPVPEWHVAATLSRYPTMNEQHLKRCASAEWAETVEREILPWALGGRDLGDDILEVGPGPGLTTDVLRRSVKQLTAVEVDADLARALASRLSGYNVEVVHADGTALPLEHRRFSAATCFTMLHHVPSAEGQDRLLSELRRVLRPGGLLIGVDSLDRPEWRELHAGDICVPVEPETLADRLARAGFVEIEVERDSREPALRFRFAARAPLL